MTRFAWPNVEVLADEKAITATLFLRRAVAFYRCHGAALPGWLEEYNY
ncbi:MAG: hypothetical protein ACR2ND_13475 [Solirubrobacteraceae bacterium]